LSEYTLYLGDCLEYMRGMGDESIDLTVTSPPYDNLRAYDGYTFDFEGIAKQLYRVTKPGGVVTWVVGDATINGSETGTSFRQALYFMECGFNLHDTMFYHTDKPPINDNRYHQCIEFMFILSKGKPKTYNPIMVEVSDNPLSEQRRKYKSYSGYQRNVDGVFNPKNKVMNNGVKVKSNLWHYRAGFSANDSIASIHPAVFPEALARDHIISWSNSGDLVFDPMCGSGTTGEMAIQYQRNFIGCDVSEKYIAIAEKRIKQAQMQMLLPLDIERSSPMK